MQIYLPIAEASIDIFLLLLLGGGVGFLSGLFGVGGGFLMTPLLIFIGIPPAVAVGSGAAQNIASSISGVIAHMRKGNVDFRMGGVLLGGGIVGSTLGVQIFALLRSSGQVEFFISIAYVVVLGTVGGLMLTETINTLRKRWQNKRSGAAPVRRKLHEHIWLHGLPLKMRFPHSKLYISALAPFGIGAIVGMLSALLGVGGGFIMVPAMIYLLGMPTVVVIGTSLFQIIFVSANVTYLQALAGTDGRYRLGRAAAGRRCGRRAIRGALRRQIARRILARVAGADRAVGRDQAVRRSGDPARGYLFDRRAHGGDAVAMKRLFLLLGLLCAAFAPQPARAQALVADLSSHLIAITAGFAGTELLLFGATEGEGDVVVLVRGPDSDVAVRRKARVAGIWLNTETLSFANVPSYYRVASSKPLDEVVTPALRQRHQIGSDFLRLAPSRDADAIALAAFRAGIGAQQGKAWGFTIPSPAA